jgi:glutathione peroxidase|tara:strand:- start:4791 stop:5384 length:594 start_codon:yes stop_codon:yes gene_type:complete
MKTYIIITLVAAIFIALGFSAWNLYGGVNTYTPTVSHTSFYDLSCNTLEGETFDFESLIGKKVLIVNTASECGFTPQYEGLQKLHEQYGGDGFVILGFPCNDFGKQESGTSEEIGAFCSKNFGVTFQMMEKVSVKGSNTHSVYKWLLNESENGVSNHNVRWNFHKFLIDENGALVASLRSGVNPDDKRVINFLNNEN